MVSTMLKRILSIFTLCFGVYMSSAIAAESAIFAMGCFWCAEAEFRDNRSNYPLPGIRSIKVGYAGGVTPNPTYNNHEGYTEAIRIEYEPALITFEDLLDIFWRNVDPFDKDGQFCDRGDSYISVIYYDNREQKEFVEKSKQRYEKLLGREIVTKIVPASTFFNAEEEHQNYSDKNPNRYKFYRWKCGRDKRLKEIWQDAKE